MMSCKKCQCGATPLYHVVRADRKGRKRQPTRERIVCPFCGNRTSANASRHTLRMEWNSAGWCGQAEVGGLAQRATAVMRNTYLIDDEFHNVAVMNKVPPLWPRRGVRGMVITQTDDNGRCISIKRVLPTPEGVRGFTGRIVLDDLTVEGGVE